MPLAVSPRVTAVAVLAVVLSLPVLAQATRPGGASDEDARRRTCASLDAHHDPETCRSAMAMPSLATYLDALQATPGTGLAVLQAYLERAAPDQVEAAHEALMTLAREIRASGADYRVVSEGFVQRIGALCEAEPAGPERTPPAGSQGARCRDAFERLAAEAATVPDDLTRARHLGPGAPHSLFSFWVRVSGETQCARYWSAVEANRCSDFVQDPLEAALR